MKKSSQPVAWRLTRAGSGPPNPQTIAQRSRTFAATAHTAGEVLLVTKRDDAGLHHFVELPASAGSEQAAMHLAQAVAANATQVDELPLLDAPTVGWLTVRGGTVASRDAQTGTDPAEVARRLNVAMRPGSWVAAVNRAPSRAEVRRVRRWYEHRLGTHLPVHHTSDDQTFVMSLWAGGADRQEVKSLLAQVAAALPGFDVDVTPTTSSLLSAVAPWSLLSIGGFAGMLAAGFDPMLTGAVAAGPGLVAGGVATGLLPSKARAVARDAASGTLPIPRKRILPPRKPQAAGFDRQTGRETPGRDGDYPLHPSSFLVGPAVVVGLVAPHAGAASGTSTTESRDVPARLLDRIGPVIGRVDRQDVHIDAAMGYQGLAIAGQPGVGKSVILRSLWGWHCLERARPTGTDGWPGDRNAMVAFESKGDGARLYADWAQAAGDRTLMIEVGDDDGWAIDMLDVPGTARDKAQFLTNAMVYAFGEKAIQDRSFTTLTAVLSAALCVDDTVARKAELPTGRSPLWYAHVLLGGQSDDKGVKLAAALSEAAVVAEQAAVKQMIEGAGGTPGSDPVTEIGHAEQRLGPLYGDRVTPAQRRNLTEAPRSKIGQLIEAEGWWGPQRRKVGWDRILDEHRSVVINTGVTADGTVVDERLNQQMASLLMYSLRAAIMRRCSGWRDGGRAITIFSDELSLVAGNSPEVVTWLRNQGRSYGVRPYFATQYPEQLPMEVRRAFLSFGTALWFAQNSAEIAQAAATDLSLGGDEWKPAEIAGLEPYTAVLRASVGQRRQPPVPISLPYWEADIDGYAAVQGWPDDG